MPTDFTRKRAVGSVIKPNPAAVRKVAVASRPGAVITAHGSLIPHREASKSTPLSCRSSSSPRPLSISPATDGKHAINGLTTHGKRSATSALNPAVSKREKAGLNGNARKRGSPAVQAPLTSDTDDGDSDSSLDFDAPQKRLRANESLEPDSKRIVKSVTSFSADAHGVFDMVHAADITTIGGKVKYEGVFNKDGAAQEPDTKTPEVSLQYPGAIQKERYLLVKPHDKDDFWPLTEIRNIVDIVARDHLPEKAKEDARTIWRRLGHATQTLNQQEYCDAVETYNQLLADCREDGTVEAELDKLQRVPLQLVEFILDQVRVRISSPRVSSLKKYKNGTDNVYGELLPPFISKIFKETKLKSDQLFIDLGSGIGNVVIQAALQTGCESWGCEMMKNACDIADLQAKEFKSRCRLWGLAPGEVHLERGDFLENETIQKKLQAADVVLVNNQAFTSELNEKLTRLFLDLKEGCLVVSLKSFVPAGHKISERNLYSPVNVLVDREMRYFEGSVSWADNHGTYHIARKDTSVVEAFRKRIA